MGFVLAGVIPTTPRKTDHVPRSTGTWITVVSTWSLAAFDAGRWCIVTFNSRLQMDTCRFLLHSQFGTVDSRVGNQHANTPTATSQFPVTAVRCQQFFFSPFVNAFSFLE